MSDPISHQPIGQVVLPSAHAVLFRRHLPDMSPAKVPDLRPAAASGMRELGIPFHTISLVSKPSPIGVTQLHHFHFDAVRERTSALLHWRKHIEFVSAGLEGWDL